MSSAELPTGVLLQLDPPPGAAGGMMCVRSFLLGTFSSFSKPNYCVCCVIGPPFPGKSHGISHSTGPKAVPLLRVLGETAFLHDGQERSRGTVFVSTSLGFLFFVGTDRATWLAKPTKRIVSWFPNVSYGVRPQVQAQDSAPPIKSAFKRKRGIDQPDQDRKRMPPYPKGTRTLWLTPPDRSGRLVLLYPAPTCRRTNERLAEVGVEAAWGCPS